MDDISVYISKETVKNRKYLINFFERIKELKKKNKIVDVYGIGIKENFNFWSEIYEDNKLLEENCDRKHVRIGPEYQIDLSAIDVGVSYNFYEEYIDNLNFKTKLNERTLELKKRYLIDKNMPLNRFIQNYFVEVFSWSILTKDVLSLITNVILNNNLTGVIDPCCGNGFHTYLFNCISKINTFTADIQNEPFSWIPITEKEGREFLTELPELNHKSHALILSWIDYESLTIDLLNLYKGNMIISIGNYDKLSPNYISEINRSFDMIQRIILNMPWDLTEKIEIYIRKN